MADWPRPATADDGALSEGASPVAVRAGDCPHGPQVVGGSGALLHEVGAADVAGDAWGGGQRAAASMEGAVRDLNDVFAHAAPPGVGAGDASYQEHQVRCRAVPTDARAAVAIPAWWP